MSTNRPLYLQPASTVVDWVAAATLLAAVARKLETLQMPLWARAQISALSLQELHTLEQLHFINLDSTRVGLVFLMDDDPWFWPESAPGSSLFFHKLALDPDHQGLGLGAATMALLDAHAARAGRQWLRLDCDDRAPLHRFYSGNGFALVDTKRVGPYSVCRYQRRIRTRPGLREAACSS